MHATLDNARFSFSGAFANRDINNTPLTELPLMADLHSTEDISLAIVFDVGAPGANDYIFAWRATGAVTNMIAAATAANIPAQTVNYNTGLLKGILGGMSAAAQYETILGIPDSATKGVDAQGLAHLVIVAFVVLGNIGHFVTKSQEPV